MSSIFNTLKSLFNTTLFKFRQLFVVEHHHHHHHHINHHYNYHSHHHHYLCPSSNSITSSLPPQIPASILNNAFVNIDEARLELFFMGLELEAGDIPLSSPSTISSIAFDPMRTVGKYHNVSSSFLEMNDSNE